MTSGIFWKCKLLHALIILNNVNYLLRVQPSLVYGLASLIVDGFKVNCVVDNIHLNSIGRVGLFYLMREAKTTLYRKSTRPTAPLTSTDLETFLTWRFLPRSDADTIAKSYVPNSPIIGRPS